MYKGVVESEQEKHTVTQAANERSQTVYSFKRDCYLREKKTAGGASPLPSFTWTGADPRVSGDANNIVATNTSGR